MCFEKKVFVSTEDLTRVRVLPLMSPLPIGLTTSSEAPLSRWREGLASSVMKRRKRTSTLPRLPFPPPCRERPSPKSEPKQEISRSCPPRITDKSQASALSGGERKNHTSHQVDTAQQASSPKTKFSRNFSHILRFLR